MLPLIFMLSIFASFCSKQSLKSVMRAFLYQDASYHNGQASYILSSCIQMYKQCSLSRCQLSGLKV